MTAHGSYLASVVRRGVVRRSAAAALGIATVIAANGCGGPARRAIAGSVTLDGRPLDEAVIMFVPLAVPGSKTGAAVTAGRYEVPSEVGVLPGRYRVEIADNPPIDSWHGPGRSSVPARRTLPVAYSSTASPLAIDIAASGQVVFDFALTTQPSPTP